MRVFHSIGVFAYRFRWVVCLLWGALLLASLFFAPELSGRLKGGGFEGSDSEAERVQRLMSDEFKLSPATLTVVFEGEGIPARGEQFQREEQRALEGVRKLDEVRYVASYAGSEDERFISKDGEKSYAVIAFNVSIDETRNLVEEVRREFRSEVFVTYVKGAPAVYEDLEAAGN